ncbi:hypothetical protein ACFXKC_38395 [Streptomyces sp. NPDC059340]|uniref:hypothetical protein n=1 Tax=Streptomyces sp. NPDC059340 TaxID=3346806 RepID=UPI003691265B
MFVERVGVFVLERLRPLAVAAAILLSFATLGEARAAGSSDPLQQQIDDVLAKTDGGVQISRNEIAWNGGEVIMAFPLPGETQAPVSSPAAQRLQAEVVGVAADATEQPPADESESDSSATASDSCPTEWERLVLLLPVQELRRQETAVERKTRGSGVLLRV